MRFRFVFLRLVYHILAVSLDCPFFIAPSVFSNVSNIKYNVCLMSVMNHTIKIMGQWVSLSKIISPQVSSAISWQSALLVEKFKQNHRTAVRHFSYNGIRVSQS
jgi:hypothetical protein